MVKGIANSYRPEPGSIPQLAIDYLKQQPAGIQLDTYALLDAIGKTGLKGFYAHMQPAVRAGLVDTEPLPGRQSVLWSLGDGTPVDTCDIDRISDVPNPSRALSSVFTAGEALHAHSTDKRPVMVTLSQQRGKRIAAVMAALGAAGPMKTFQLAQLTGLTSKQIWGLLKHHRAIGSIQHSDGLWRLAKHVPSASASLLLRVHTANSATPQPDTDVIIFIAPAAVGQLGAYLGNDQHGPHWVNAHGERVVVSHWSELPALHGVAA